MEGISASNQLPATAMAFPMSYTAPRFTESDYQQEIHNLTPEQIHGIECERRGIRPLRRETPEMREQGLRDLEMKLSKILDKEDYLRALEIAPLVVQSESNPLFFLRCENYDASAAAKRLARYWKTRCIIFGERAFLPLTLSGEGALTAGDIEDLRGGAMQLLEPDDMGRPVIYFRRAALTFTESRRPVLLRMLMYVFARICKDPFLQRHGYVFIVNTMGYTADNNDRKASKKLIDTTKDIAPVRICCTHLCYSEMKCLARLFLPTILFFLGKELRQRACIHYGGANELLFDFALYGMNPRSLPDSIGGKFSLEQWQQTLEKFRAEEQLQDGPDQS